MSLQHISVTPTSMNIKPYPEVYHYHNIKLVYKALQYMCTSLNHYLSRINDNIDGAVYHQHEMVPSSEVISPGWPVQDCTIADHLDIGEQKIRNDLGKSISPELLHRY